MPLSRIDASKKTHFCNCLDSEFAALKGRLADQFELLLSPTSSGGVVSIFPRDVSHARIVNQSSNDPDKPDLEVFPSIVSTPCDVSTPRGVSTPRDTSVKGALPVTPREYSVSVSSPRFCNSPRTGPRILANHVKTPLVADEHTSDTEKEDGLDNAAVVAQASSKTALYKSPTAGLSVGERWIHLVHALMRPKSRMYSGATKFELHDCWANYCGMLRRNEDDCQSRFASVKGKVLRGRQGNSGTSRTLESLMSWQFRVGASSHIMRFMLHPDSCKRGVWIMCSFIILLFDVVVLPIIAFFDLDESDAMRTISWIVAFFWVLDIAVSFLSGRYVQGVLELRPGPVARIYLKTWFLFDFALVTMDLTVAFVETFVEARHLTVFGVMVNGARIVRLARLLRLQKLQTTLRDAFEINSKGIIVFSGLVRTTLFYLCYAHFLACLWYGIGLTDSRGWGSTCRTQESQVSHCYFRAFQWALTHSLGASIIEYSTTAEWVFSTCFLFSGLVFFAILLGKAVEAVTQFTGADKLEMRQRCVELTRHYSVSPELSHRLIRYIEGCDVQVDLSHRIQKDREILQILPLIMQCEFLEETRKVLLTKSLIMRDLSFVSTKLFRHLCANATTMQFIPNSESVFCNGDTATNWRIVDKGHFMYMSGVDCWSDVAETMLPFWTGMEEAKKEEAALKFKSNSKSMPGSASSLFSSGSTITKLFKGYDSSPAMTKGLTDTSPSHASTQVRTPGTWDCFANCASGRAQSLQRGRSLSEMVLWTTWVHTGEMIATSDGTLLQLAPEDFFNVVKVRVDTCLLVSRYAQQFVKTMSNKNSAISDLYEYEPDEDDDQDAGGMEHLVFLSHYKAEAGTEATLMREALRSMIAGTGTEVDDDAIFLDSEDLTDLASLKDHVINSRNLVLLLTPGVLTRPWCLLEAVCAQANGVQIVPVEIQRPGLKFAYPDDTFYTQLRNGSTLSHHDKRLLTTEGITLDSIEETLRSVFRQIALPFSPHKSKGIREAELTDIVQRCNKVKPMLRSQKSEFMVSSSVAVSPGILSINSNGKKGAFDESGKEAVRWSLRRPRL